jgi:hypothetical protein
MSKKFEFEKENLRNKALKSLKDKIDKSQSKYIAGGVFRSGPRIRADSDILLDEIINYIGEVCNLLDKDRCYINHKEISEILKDDIYTHLLSDKKIKIILEQKNYREESNRIIIDKEITRYSKRYAKSIKELFKIIVKKILSFVIDKIIHIIRIFL